MLAEVKAHVATLKKEQASELEETTEKAAAKAQELQKQLDEARELQQQEHADANNLTGQIESLHPQLAAARDQAHKFESQMIPFPEYNLANMHMSKHFL